MASDEKKTKTNPAPKEEAVVKKESAVKPAASIGQLASALIA